MKTAPQLREETTIPPVSEEEERSYPTQPKSNSGNSTIIITQAAIFIIIDIFINDISSIPMSYIAYTIIVIIIIIIIIVLAHFFPCHSPVYHVQHKRSCGSCLHG